MLRRKIIQVGGASGMTIPKHEMRRLGLKRGDEVIVSVKPVTTSREQRITALTANFIDRYRDDLEALASK